MKSVRLIDTSILCEILEIPGKSNPVSAKKVVAEFCRLARKDVRFILPLATLIETGNHIAQNGDGNIRRKKAQELVEFVKKSMEVTSPFRQILLWNSADLRAWMDAFPDSAMRGIGLGDVSIMRDLEKAKSLLPSNTPIDIWSKDDHLA